VLYVLAFLLEFIICFFSCAGCSYDCSLPMWTGKTFGSIIAILSLAGIVIGVIYAIAVNTQAKVEESSEKRKSKSMQQRQEYASEFKRKSDNAISECEYHQNKTAKLDPKMIKMNPNHEAKTLQEKLWYALDDVSTSLQKLDDIVSELKIEEGKLNENY